MSEASRRGPSERTGDYPGEPPGADASIDVRPVEGGDGSRQGSSIEIGSVGPATVRESGKERRFVSDELVRAGLALAFTGVLVLTVVFALPIRESRSGPRRRSSCSCSFRPRSRFSVQQSGSTTARVTREIGGRGARPMRAAGEAGYTPAIETTPFLDFP